MEENKGLLAELMDKKSILVLDQVMDSLTSQFMDLKVSNVASCDFTRNKCRVSLKKAHFHSVNLNS